MSDLRNYISYFIKNKFLFATLFIFIFLSLFNKHVFYFFIFLTILRILQFTSFSKMKKNWNKTAIFKLKQFEFILYILKKKLIFTQISFADLNKTIHIIKELKFFKIFFILAKNILKNTLEHFVTFWKKEFLSLLIITEYYINLKNFNFLKPNTQTNNINYIFFRGTKTISSVLPANTYSVFLQQITHQIAYAYQFLKTWIMSLIVTIFTLSILIDFFSINFIKQLAIWLVVGFLVFWLFSSFNFFLKRYRFAKFTSAIQRFWKRTNSYFWILEGFLFGLFIYYFLNSAQEPLYMFDESSLNQQYLLFLPTFYQNYIILLLIFAYTLILLLLLPTIKFFQQIIHLTVMTLVLIYLYLIESYQAYYLLTSFFEFSWTYDVDNYLWINEIENPKFRIKQQYLIIALLLKYWHFVFIFLSWIFFVQKSFERKQVTFVLLGANSQNLLILLLLNALFIAQWFKWFFKRFSESAYYWFFANTNDWTLYLFLQECLILDVITFKKRI